MNDQVDIGLLEKYLRGEIDAVQVTFLDGTPLSQAELKGAILEHEDLALHVEGSALKDELKSLHETLGMDKPKVSFPNWLKAAAAILLIGVLGTLVWYNSGRAPQFEDYYEHFDQLVTYRDSDTTGYSQALELYTERNYAEAYKALIQVAAPNSELKFYTALSALGSGYFDKAIEIFESLSIENHEKYHQQIPWYLGLAYWQAGNKAQAIQSLSKIAAGDFEYDRAQNLLQYLKG